MVRTAWGYSSSVLNDFEDLEMNMGKYLLDICGQKADLKIVETRDPVPNGLQMMHIINNWTFVSLRGRMPLSLTIGLKAWTEHTYFTARNLGLTRQTGFPFVWAMKQIGKLGFGIDFDRCRDLECLIICMLWAWTQSKQFQLWSFSVTNYDGPRKGKWRDWMSINLSY